MKDRVVMAETHSTASQDVRRRRVFYLPGYDPMLPRRYRELYRSEGRKQAKISGYSIDLKGNTTSQTYSWTVTTEIDKARTTSEVELLFWSDIVQESMQRSIVGTFLLLAHVVWIYVSSGALWRLMRLRKGPVIAALYPVFMLSAQLLLAVFLALAGSWILGHWAPLWLALLGAGAILAAVMIGFRRLDGRLFAYYLLHDYAFSAQYKGANPPRLEARIRDFADRIEAALKEDVDEVLVVGHSSGAHLAVSVLADLLARPWLATFSPRLSFLSLGHVVPMVSFLPRADALRRDLAALSAEPRLSWVDVTAPGDGCTFALVDPVTVSGVAPAGGHHQPLVISAAFTNSLSDETRAAMKWRYFRIHFQYLCAFDRPGDYDYFQITAGPLSLARRYAGRAPSPSCLAIPLSPHRGIGPARRKEVERT